ncbi:MAG: hypothetical protein PF450_01925 [Bacteroidales bacterium]|jgi:hypothetical protein|nr:hypothetical protein [Bacteroidales bacterium]
MNDKRPDIEELKKMVVNAEIKAALATNPELKKKIETILSGVDSQLTSVKDATNNIIELINGQATRVE